MSGPARFDKITLKRVATINDEALGENTDPDLELKYVDIGNVDSAGHILEIATYRFENAPSRARRIVRDGDVIISTVRTYLLSIAPIQLPPDNLIVSTGFAVVRPQQGFLDTGFCRYALREPEFIHEVIGRSVGITYPAINASDLADIPIHVPPLPTQRVIAEYLDRETAHIDALIDTKERLLELLAEKRRALIAHAVTYGLNPNTPMRDSGVEWLGEIPADWEVDLVKRHFQVELGKMLNSSQQRDERGELKPYLRAANVYWDGVWLDDVNEMIFTQDQLERYRLQKGDLLVTEGGVTVGRSTIWQGEIQDCYYQNSLNRARPKGRVPSKFLYYWLYFLKLNGYIDTITEKSTFAHLTNEKLEVIPMTVPPTSQIMKIIQVLDKELAQIDNVEKKVKDAIALLRERRTALIAAAVTGQIQVTS